VKVTLAYEYTDADGKTHAPNKTIDLDIAEANRLLHYGLARVPESAPEKKG
jgi:hypothetical protein